MTKYKQNMTQYTQICQNITKYDYFSNRALKKKNVVLVTDAPGLGLPNIGQIWSDLSYIHQYCQFYLKHVQIKILNSERGATLGSNKYIS